jgi:hypothetical protein
MLRVGGWEKQRGSRLSATHPPHPPLTPPHRSLCTAPPHHSLRAAPPHCSLLTAHSPSHLTTHHSLPLQQSPGQRSPVTMLCWSRVHSDCRSKELQIVNLSLTVASNFYMDRVFCVTRTFGGRRIQPLYVAVTSHCTRNNGFASLKTVTHTALFYFKITHSKAHQAES